MLKKNSRGGVRVRVCSRIKDYEVGISELGHHNIGLYDVLAAAPVNLSTTSLPPKKSKEEEEENQDYYVNTGYAIRTLREEFPELFYKELTFNIYRFEQIWIYMSSMYVHMCMHLYFCFLISKVLDQLTHTATNSLSDLRQAICVICWDFSHGKYH